MVNRVDPKTLERILYLHRQGLSQNIISQRLGISTRTIRVYLRAERLGLKPYETPSGSQENDNLPS